MNGQTAADAVIAAGREAVTAIGAGRDRSGGSDPDATGTFVVLTLVVLAVEAVPILGIAVVGYILRAARDPDAPVSGGDDWVAVAAAGARGTALLVGAALPVVAALLGSGTLGVKTGSIVIGPTPGPLLGVGLATLAAAAWHAGVVGVVAVATGDDCRAIRDIRFGCSAEGVRLSVALAGVAGVVGAVGFGLTAIPVVGALGAAGVGALGIVVAGKLVGRGVAGARRRSAGGSAASEDRLATPTHGSDAGLDGDAVGRSGQRDGGVERGPAGPAATPRRSRRGRP